MSASDTPGPSSSGSTSSLRTHQAIPQTPHDLSAAHRLGQIPSCLIGGEPRHVTVSRAGGHWCGLPDRERYSRSPTSLPHGGGRGSVCREPTHTVGWHDVPAGHLYREHHKKLAHEQRRLAHTVPFSAHRKHQTATIMRRGLLEDLNSPEQDGLGPWLRRTPRMPGPAKSGTQQSRPRSGMGPADTDVGAPSPVVRRHAAFGRLRVHLAKGARPGERWMCGIAKRKPSFTVGTAITETTST